MKLARFRRIDVARTTYASLALGLLLLTAGVPVFGEATIRTVALTGAAATTIDGVPLGGLNQYFSAPVIDQFGRTAFQGWLAGKRGWISESLGPGLRAFGVDGEPTPGIEGSRFLSPVGRPYLSDSGHLAFRAFFAASQYYHDIGLWQVRSESQPALVARGLGHAPGTTYSFNSFDVLATNRSGTLAFSAGISKSPYDSRTGIWTTRGGDLELVAQATDPIPGDPNAAFLGFQRVALNNRDDILFSSSGLWLSTSDGSMENIYRQGAAVPSVGGRQFGGDAQQISVNDVRQVAFMERLVASVDDPGVNSVWTGSVDTLRMVAVAEQAVPGVSGKQFIDFLSVELSQRSRISFIAAYDRQETYSGGTTLLRGIWSDGFSPDVQLVAREGGEAPGVGQGKFRWLNNISMNAAGQVAFLGTLEHVLDPLPSPPGDNPPRTGLITSSNDQGIWAQDRQGILRLVLREGETIDVASGPATDMRTINAIAFLARSGGEEEGSGSFNDRGQLAFLAQFTDGSQGIFVSNLVAVPECDTCTIALWSVLLMVGYRRVSHASYISAND